MNRTIKDATVKRFHYETHDELGAHLADFVSAYNFAKRLKTLKGLTPYEYICKVLDERARAIHPQSAPANAGTKHLELQPSSDAVRTDELVFFPLVGVRHNCARRSAARRSAFWSAEVEKYVHCRRELADPSFYRAQIVHAQIMPPPQPP